MRKSIHGVPGDGTKHAHSDMTASGQFPKRSQDTMLIGILGERGINNELGKGSTLFPCRVGYRSSVLSVDQLPGKVLP